MNQKLKKLTQVKDKRKIVALVAAGSVILGVGTWVIIRAINKHKAERDADRRLKDNANKAVTSATGRNITDDKAKSIANALFEAMDGIGTDETEIYTILVVNNKLSSLDLVAVYEAFGNKEYGTFGTPWWGSGDKLDLIGWIKKEMSNTSKEYIMLRAMFNQAGLNFD